MKALPWEAFTPFRPGTASAVMLCDLRMRGTFQIPRKGIELRFLEQILAQTRRSEGRFTDD